VLGQEHHQRVVLDVELVDLAAGRPKRGGGGPGDGSKHVLADYREEIARIDSRSGKPPVLLFEPLDTARAL